MTPVHPAMVPEEPDEVHHSDNLLWSVQRRPALARWSALPPIIRAWAGPRCGCRGRRSRIWQTSFEFELAKIPDSR